MYCSLKVLEGTPPADLLGKDLKRVVRVHRDGRADRQVLHEVRDGVQRVPGRGGRNGVLPRNLSFGQTFAEMLPDFGTGFFKILAQLPLYHHRFCE